MKSRRGPKKIRERARSLRRTLTDEERQLWNRIRNRAFGSFKFRRQVPVGNYIVDFVCAERKLIVELDGGQHNDAGQRQYDGERTRYLESQGYIVLRFWNHEVRSQWNAVEQAIWNALEVGQSPTPEPLNRDT